MVYREFEIFFGISGRMTVLLEHRKTKERETFTLDGEEHTALYIPAGLAHAVRAESADAVLLVTSSAPDITGTDEFQYQMTS